MAAELWLKVEQHPYYQVSDRGRVRKVRNRHGKLAEPRQVTVVHRKVGSGGTWWAVVSLHQHAERFTLGLARLVLTTFIGAPEPQQEARFINGDPRNCDLENLYWGYKKGESRSATLKVWQVQEIRRLIRIGLQLNKIATRIGVLPGTISSIKLGHTWSWLPEFDNPKPWDIHRYTIEHGCDQETARDALVHLKVVEHRRKALRCSSSSRRKEKTVSSTISTPTAP